MSMNFRADLTESCDAAAKFLRSKLSERKIKKSITDEIYSGEREFVCEVYRRLVNKNKSYRDNLFVEYFPDPEDKGEKTYPDLVFSDGSGNKSVVEIKVNVNKRKKDALRLLEQDKGPIIGDCNKLKNYKHFKSKFLVVAYLGDLKCKDGTEFQPKDLKIEISKICTDAKEIQVISC